MSFVVICLDNRRQFGRRQIPQSLRVSLGNVARAYERDAVRGTAPGAAGKGGAGSRSRAQHDGSVLDLRHYPALAKIDLNTRICPAVVGAHPKRSA